MAEGIARARYPDFASYTSAGTYAMRGSTPSENAVAAAAELGADISRLRGRSLRKASKPLPDRIFVMTERHRDRVVAMYPGLADRVALLDVRGDIADPYGLDLEFYRQTRDRIAAAIDARFAELQGAATPD